MKNSITKILTQCLTICFCAAAFAGFAEAQISNGGNHTLTQTATANGGAGGAGAGSGGSYTIEGTTGQSAAGTKQQSGNYSFHPGFWTAHNFAPTAAGVTVGGRIVTANGNGIRNVLVTLTKANGEKRAVFSGSFGYFRFGDITAGETCVLTVSAKRYTFSQPTQIHSFVDDISDLIFTADF